MNALITAMVLWLSANFDLPAIQDHPRIALASSAKLMALRYRNLLVPQSQMGEAPGPAGRPEVIAVYDDASRTIYLHETWTGSTSAELSVLVHEIVHHIQNVTRRKYPCPQEREQLAFQAQQRWLELFGASIEREFEIDAVSILVMTRCPL